MKKSSKKNLAKELAEELDVFDEMLSSLVEILEEKGILTQEEWEKKIKSKLSRRVRKYRDVQFGKE